MYTRLPTAIRIELLYGASPHQCQPLGHLLATAEEMGHRAEIDRGKPRSTRTTNKEKGHAMRSPFPDRNLPPPSLRWNWAETQHPTRTPLARVDWPFRTSLNIGFTRNLSRFGQQLAFRLARFALASQGCSNAPRHTPRFAPRASSCASANSPSL